MRRLQYAAGAALAALGAAALALILITGLLLAVLPVAALIVGLTLVDAAQAAGKGAPLRALMRAHVKELRRRGRRPAAAKPERRAA